MTDLTGGQRYTIFALKQENYSNKKIAAVIGKSESTISRELKRNSTKTGRYSVRQAQENFTRYAKNGSICLVNLRLKSKK